MKQDIKNLFKDDNGNKKLPNSHREEFLAKLKGSKVGKKKILSYNFIYKTAAAILIFISAGYFAIIDKDKKLTVQTSLELQLDELERQYLVSIDSEWQNFLMIAEDTILINRYEHKLNSLANDYYKISKKFRSDTNNIILIEELVENLQTRLKILMDIQEHIELLNQKTENNEINSI